MVDVTARANPADGGRPISTLVPTVGLLNTPLRADDPMLGEKVM